MPSPVGTAFDKNLLKRFPELIPLFGVVGLAAMMFIGYGFYGLMTKNEVTLTRGVARFEKIDPEKVQKMMGTPNMAYEKIPELEALRKEIGSYKVT